MPSTGTGPWPGQVPPRVLPPSCLPASCEPAGKLLHPAGGPTRPELGQSRCRTSWTAGAAAATRLVFFAPTASPVRQPASAQTLLMYEKNAYICCWRALRCAGRRGPVSVAPSRVTDQLLDTAAAALTARLLANAAPAQIPWATNNSLASVPVYGALLRVRAPPLSQLLIGRRTALEGSALPSPVSLLRSQSAARDGSRVPSGRMARLSCSGRRQLASARADKAPGSPCSYKKVYQAPRLCPATLSASLLPAPPPRPSARPTTGWLLAELRPPFLAHGARNPRGIIS